MAIQQNLEINWHAVVTTLHQSLRKELMKRKNLQNIDQVVVKVLPKNLSVEIQGLWRNRKVSDSFQILVKMNKKIKVGNKNQSRR